MRSEDFDKKIKDASEHHFPAYDETAWGKMNQLLNEHLPRQKDRRRRFLFILFTVLFIGGATSIILINKQPASPSLADRKNTEINSTSNGSNNSASATGGERIQESSGNNNPQPGNTTGTNQTDIAETSSTQQTSADNQAIKGSFSQQKVIDEKSYEHITKSADKRTTKSTKKPSTYNRTQSPIKNNSIASAPLVVDDQSQSVPNQIVHYNTVNTPEAALTLLNTSVDIEQVKLNIPPTSSGSVIPEESIVDNSNPAPLPTQSSKNNKNKFLSKIGISVSAGPDISGVNVSKAGELTMGYGAGLSYAISKKFTVRTGLYVADKIYTADPEDYKPPKHYWTYYVDMEQVDADCRVLEWPIQVNYNFITGKNHNFFGSTGISSYFMKKESYYYHYYDQQGQYQYNGWSMENKNKHFFSIVTLSAGYEYRFNNKLSIMGEPYAKLPLTGVGFGKIMLNSAGVLFSVNYKPFEKR